MSAARLDLSNIGYLKGSQMNVAIRKAVNKAMAPVKAAVVSDAPQGENGLLKKSIKIKVKYYSKSGTWVGMAGPSKATKKVKRRKPKKTAKKPKKKATKAPQQKGRKRSSKLQRRARKIGKAAAKGAKRAKKGLKAVGRFVGRLGVVKRIKRKVKRLREPKPQIIKPSRYSHLAGPGQHQRFLDSAYSKTHALFVRTVIEELHNAVEQIAPAKSR